MHTHTHTHTHAHAHVHAHSHTRTHVHTQLLDVLVWSPNVRVMCHSVESLPDTIEVGWQALVANF